MLEFYGTVKYPEEFSINYNSIPDRTKIQSVYDLRHLQYIIIENNSLDNNNKGIYVCTYSFLYMYIFLN